MSVSHGGQRDGYGRFQPYYQEEFDGMDEAGDPDLDPEALYFDPAVLHPHKDFGTNPIFRADRTSAMYKKTKRSFAPVAEQASVTFQAAERSMTLSGREYVSTVQTPTYTAAAISGFTTTSQLLRPTDSVLFSWLAGIAKKFEEFKFHKLVFTYEPQCSTSTTGSVAMWFDSDPTHSAPANWNSVINTAANVHGAPWAKHVFAVPSHLYSGRRSYYTRNEFVDVNQQPNSSTGYQQPVDPLEYYPGVFGFCSQDVQISASPWNLSLGKVYLDYSVSFKIANTDSWNITSMLTRQLLSVENAENSGTGYDVWAGPDLGVLGVSLACLATGSGCYIGAGASAGASYVPVPQEADRSGAVVCHSGSKYFNFIPHATLETTAWVARSNLELLCTIRYQQTNADCVSSMIGIIPGAAAGAAALSLVQTTAFSGTAVCPANAGGAADTTAALSWIGASRGIRLTVLNGLTSSLVSIVAAQYPQLTFQIKLVQGDGLFFRHIVTANDVTGFKLSFTPCVFGSVV